MQIKELFSILFRAVSYHFLGLSLVFRKPYHTFEGFLGCYCEIYPNINLIVFTDCGHSTMHKIKKIDGSYYFEYSYGKWKELEPIVQRSLEEYDRDFLSKEFEKNVLR